MSRSFRQHQRKRRRSRFRVLASRPEWAAFSFAEERGLKPCARVGMLRLRLVFALSAKTNPRFA